MNGANQEHGVLARTDGAPMDFAAHPVGSRLRILPNHACATAAQFAQYVVVQGTRQVAAHWARVNGW
jgi:D-serine deaminase-like pyridoxal phosphate-dependent protein